MKFFEKNFRAPRHLPLCKRKRLGGAKAPDMDWIRPADHFDSRAQIPYILAPPPPFPPSCHYVEVSSSRHLTMADGARSNCLGNAVDFGLPVDGLHPSLSCIGFDNSSFHKVKLFFGECVVRVRCLKRPQLAAESLKIGERLYHTLSRCSLFKLG